MPRSLTWRLILATTALTAILFLLGSQWIVDMTARQAAEMGDLLPGADPAVTTTLEPIFAVLRERLIALSLITILIVGIMLYFIGRSIHRPLEDLTQFALKVTAAQEDTARKDELTQLTGAIYGMARQYRTQIEALKAERKTLDAVLSHMTDGVIIVDEVGRIRLFNHAAARIFGIPAAGALNHSLAETLRYHQIVELWKGHLLTREDQVTYLELGLPPIFLQATAVSLEDALPGCTLLVIQNMTQLRRLETVRRDFVSNISHELRTPLASLKALTETLQSGALEDPGAARRFLDLIETEVDALTHLVSELLELSRIESGRVPLVFEDTRPKSLLQDVRKRMKVQAERAGLSLLMDVPSGLPHVQADPTRMEQVLVNLLHNAIKFTPAPGTITLTACEDDDTVVFSVRDTGIGISTDDLPRIFERFYKTDPSRHSTGTGLGLAIARHLVEAHGGKIWVESQEGLGSTFFFSLLTVKPDQKETRKKSSGKP